jgi:hypothetical protein
MKRHLLLSLLASVALGNDVITIEAESFISQSHKEKRHWEIRAERPGASGGSYIKALPDTRLSSKDRLINGKNFSDKPGEIAVLEYAIDVKEPGR